MNVTEVAPNALPLTDAPLEARFILSQLGAITLVFPTNLVAEILVVERSQLLPLPFYDTAILGCIHHAGRVVPLVSTYHLLQTGLGSLQERLTIIYLGQVAEEMAGVGLIVDRILGSKSESQLPADLLQQTTAQVMSEGEQQFWLFRPHFIDEKIWQPKYWQLRPT